MAVANKFGLPYTVYGGGKGQAGVYAASTYKHWGLAPPTAKSPSVMEMVKDLGKSPAFMEYAHKTYEMTQEHLKQEGIKEVTLYRGMKSAGGVENVPYAKNLAKDTGVFMNPVSSFSTSLLGFGNHKFELTAPAARIFSHAMTGPGTNYEKEFLVIGGTKLSAKVWKS